MILYFLFVIEAKQQYDKEERRKELKRLRGEDTWMLPEINQRLQEIEEVRYNVQNPSQVTTVSQNTSIITVGDNKVKFNLSQQL